MHPMATPMPATLLFHLNSQDPCMYVCSFESSSEKSDRVSKACRQIQLAHHSKPAYLLNISVAYDILCQNKGDSFAV